MVYGLTELELLNIIQAYTSWLVLVKIMVYGLTELEVLNIIQANTSFTFFGKDYCKTECIW
jgi:hypothetical protein